MSEAPASSGGNSPVKALTRKIGPFPAYVYLIGIVIGAWVVYFLRRNGQAADAGSLSDDLGVGVGGEDLSGHLDDTGIDGGVGPGGGNGGEEVDPVVDPKTNDEWFAAALGFLSDQLFYDRTEASAALQKYIQGKSLTPLEAAMVTVARSKFGSPPNGVANPPLPTDPSKPDPVKPTTPTPKPPTSPSYFGSGPTNVSVSAAWKAATVKWSKPKSSYGTVLRVNGKTYTTPGTSLVVTGLKSGWDYPATLQSQWSGNRLSSPVSFTIKTKR